MGGASLPALDESAGPRRRRRAGAAESPWRALAGHIIMVPHFIIISGIIVFEAFRRNQLPPPWLILAVVGTMIGGSIVISWWSDRKKRKGRPLVQARIVGRHERR